MVQSPLQTSDTFVNRISQRSISMLVGFLRVLWFPPTGNAVRMVAPSITTRLSQNYICSLNVVYAETFCHLEFKYFSSQKLAATACEVKTYVALCVFGAVFGCHLKYSTSMNIYAQSMFKEVFKI